MKEKLIPYKLYTLPNSIFKDRNTLNNTKQQHLKLKTYYVVIQKIRLGHIRSLGISPWIVKYFVIKRDTPIHHTHCQHPISLRSYRCVYIFWNYKRYALNSIETRDTIIHFNETKRVRNDDVKIQLTRNLRLHIWKNLIVVQCFPINASPSTESVQIIYLILTYWIFVDMQYSEIINYIKFYQTKIVCAEIFSRYFKEKTDSFNKAKQYFFFSKSKMMT
ncbi:hypothetical protein AGLY_011192 [Aphis glycines]|uniref:Uncharacterized protein n=1 Tax=Aphis glycines TaxID=307491 RepID=A0A6G0TCQ4_APHGL|nr:hypothetical protein AGLY_011192 [Aphis glycines]